MASICAWEAHGRCVAPSHHRGTRGSMEPSNIAVRVATLAVFATHRAAFAAKWQYRRPRIPLNPGDSTITLCKSGKNGNVDCASQLYRLARAAGLVRRRIA